MPVVFSATITVKDWQALRTLYREVIIDKARTLKAVHCRIHRNPHNATQALLLIELPNAADGCEMRSTIITQCGLLPTIILLGDRLWEPLDWETPETS